MLDNLPVELNERILSFLDTNALRSLLMVNHPWRIKVAEFLYHQMLKHASTTHNPGLAAAWSTLQPSLARDMQALRVGSLNNSCKFAENLLYLKTMIMGQRRFHVGLAHSFMWLENHLWVCGRDVFSPTTSPHHTTLTHMTGPWGEATILGVAAGSDHTIIWTAAGAYVCGNNEDGQLGLGDTANCTTFTRMGGNSGLPPWGSDPILGVTAGMYHTIIWTAAGVYVCGDNRFGQLGLGHEGGVCKTFTPVGGRGSPPWGQAPILSVAAGYAHNIIWTAAGVYVCGDNRFGQLGLGHKANRTAFTRVGENGGLPPWGQAPILGIAAGAFHSIIWTAAGVYVCGQNDFGQLGLSGYMANYTTFTRVGGNGGLPPWGQADIWSVAAGYAHTIIWTAEGAYVCGNNQYGQLGLGHKANCTTFTHVGGNGGLPPWGTDPILGVTGNHHTIIWTATGAYVCGNNQYGQLGLGHKANCTTFTLIRTSLRGIRM